MKNNIINAFTVDVEDAVNQAMRNYFYTEMAPTMRVYNNTMQLLDLLTESSTLATFFVLGEVAETYPRLIKEISRCGHELGIHGYSHLRYYNLSKEKAREEIVRSKNIIEDITGIKVLGHRAPEFSINQKTLWVLEILLENGFIYDSSIFPISSFHYGWPGFKKEIGWLCLDNGRRIVEAPLATVNYLGRDLPGCGGGYMRVLPYIFTDQAMKRINNKRPAVVYVHPYEIDPPPFQQFYMNEVRRSSFKNILQLKGYWYNRRSVKPKLKKLLHSYRFGRLCDIIYQIIKGDI